ncbi:MAG: FG-GAP-like repeat-containing protein [Acidobacteriota bacterium]
MRRLAPFLILCSLLSFAPVTADAGGFEVVSVEPAAHALAAPVSSAIQVRFDSPVDRSTVVARQSFWAFGRWSGAVDGSFEFSDGDRVVTLRPDRPFSAGEMVMVVLSNGLASASGAGLRSAGYSFQFWIAAASTSLEFEEVQRFSTRTTQGQTTQSYGGFASDLDEDGFLDLTIVNEDTNDVRTYLNKADFTGTFDPMLTPTGVGGTPSPSEPSDFNADGHVDVAIANITGDSVSILLGAGDGTFPSHQEIPTGDAPRGIAVLDVDGDGDVDVVNTNSGVSTLTLLRNDGAGSFGAPESFGSGSDGEWALAAGDMDDDGILDLVVGGRFSETIQVYSGDGDGTFTAQPSQASGGGVWMLVLGDVDGDGDEDVAGVNAFDNNGAILLGDGQGNLAAPILHPTDPFSLATDLADLDGDGDLDWVTASFSGDWFLFENDGGTFSFKQAFDAPRAASCSLALDIDNDGDLDLALIDEIEDVVIVMAHPGVGGLIFEDGFELGNTSTWDVSFP